MEGRRHSGSDGGRLARTRFRRLRRVRQGGAAAGHDDAGTRASTMRRESEVVVVAVIYGEYVAEGLGFEPRRRSRAQRFSRPPPSTTRPSLRAGVSAPSCYPVRSPGAATGSSGLAATVSPRARFDRRRSMRGRLTRRIRPRATVRGGPLSHLADAAGAHARRPGKAARALHRTAGEIQTSRTTITLLLAVSKRPQRLKRTRRLSRGAGHLSQIRHDLAKRVVFELGERRDQESAHRPLSARIP